MPSIRPVGTGHSWTGLCTTDGVQIDVSALTGIRVVDRDRKRVAVKAGTTIFELGEALWEEGFSLKNQGDIDVPTIAGALSTGTHGSGIELGILASSVRRVRLVNGHAELVDITEDDPDALHAAQVSLGMLGIIVEVELEVVDRYYLEEEVTYPTWDALLEGWERDVADNRHTPSGSGSPTTPHRLCINCPCPKGNPSSTGRTCAASTSPNVRPARSTPSVASTATTSSTTASSPGPTTSSRSSCPPNTPAKP